MVAKHSTHSSNIIENRYHLLAFRKRTYCKNIGCYITPLAFNEKSKQLTHAR